MQEELISFENAHFRAIKSVVIIEEKKKIGKEGEKRTFWQRMNTEKVLFPVFIVLVAIFFFGLGRLTVLLSQKKPVVIRQAETRVFPEGVNWETKEEAQAEKVVGEKKYVASKNGSRYYLPNCSGVSRIDLKNQVWFGSKEEAEFNGYTPAKNCEGI